MLEFYKYHGAGNDFILLHDPDKTFDTRPNYIYQLCHRRLGIGADGLILIHSHHRKDIDFEMRYFNADGYEGSMCGNGGRCALAFAKKMQIIADEGVFIGVDGAHYGKIINEKGNLAEISLQMKNVENIGNFEDGFFLDTGSPHVVKFVENIKNIDVITEGKRIRHHPHFPKGTNVNFVEINDNYLFVRTFERGVEDETLSCGTGVTASSLSYSMKKNINTVNVKTLGGEFNVSFQKKNSSFKNIFLQGPTCFVFKGFLE
ncbi:MAG: diaminopimelate epimerase [Bacteroidales bacterium]|jgi:diaminopimelate epimerase|nr:diaminopimelate epimerase [Bacteroidales bacterium]